MRNFIVALCMILILGCSSTGTPVLPDNTSGNDLTYSTNNARNPGKISLGLYDVILEPYTESWELVPLRSADLKVNITRFLQPPMGEAGWVSFSNFDIIDYPTQGIIRLDISITHPFPGFNQFRGFDTTGVFLSDASFIPDVTDADVLPLQDGTEARVLNADGYTRWFNAIEFTADNIFGYFPGNYGIPGFTPAGTVNGYKYFCNGLEPEADL